MHTAHNTHHFLTIWPSSLPIFSLFPFLFWSVPFLIHFEIQFDQFEHLPLFIILEIIYSENFINSIHSIFLHILELLLKWINVLFIVYWIVNFVVFFVQVFWFRAINLQHMKNSDKPLFILLLKSAEQL